MGGIGGGIFLLLIGGILAFGVKHNFKALDLTTIGYVCMAVGVLTIILSLVLQTRRRTSESTQVIEHRNDRTPPVTEVVERREDRTPPPAI